MKFSFWHIVVGLVILLLGGLIIYWISGNDESTVIEDGTYDTIPIVSNASDKNRPSLLERATPYTNTFESLQEYFYTDKYSIFLCDHNAEAEQVLVLPARYQRVNDEYTLAPVKRRVGEWSQYMIGDLGNIVYPKMVFGDTFPSASFLKYDEVYQTEFTIADQDYTLAYTWINNLLVVASSRECIEKLDHTYHSH